MLIATLISIFYLTWGSSDLSFDSSDPLVYRVDPFSNPLDPLCNLADPKSKHLDPHVYPGAEDNFRAYLAWFLVFRGRPYWIRFASEDRGRGRHVLTIGKFLHLLRCLLTFKIWWDFLSNLRCIVRGIEAHRRCFDSYKSVSFRRAKQQYGRDEKYHWNFTLQLYIIYSCMLQAGSVRVESTTTMHNCRRFSPSIEDNIHRICSIIYGNAKVDSRWR